MTLDRPGRLNALSRPMIAEIVGALDQLDADDDVRAVIFTGAGRAFCAGADLAAAGPTTFGQAVSEAGDTPPDWGGILSLRLFAFNKPLIAAVNGAAIGVGATMQLPMDIRIAAHSAKFGFVFARLGIVPEAASSWFLPRIVGISTALEWCYSGRLVPAAEAQERGLIRSLHAADELLPAAIALARELTEDSAPVSIALTRQMMWRMLTVDHPRIAHEVDSKAVHLRGRSADAAEGVAAFLERRRAHFPCVASADTPDIFE